MQLVLLFAASNNFGQGMNRFRQRSRDRCILRLQGNFILGGDVKLRTEKLQAISPVLCEPSPVVNFRPLLGERVKAAVIRFGTGLGLLHTR
jgi:hypothetical protein